MVGVLILTHGGMAEELLAAGRTIMGPLEDFQALTLNWDDGLEAAEEKLEDAVQKLDKGEGVLILTDIFGGTPSNVAMKLLNPGSLQVVSGVNLPMVVRLACLRSSGTHMPVNELALWIQKKGRASICTAEAAPRPVNNIADCK